MPVQLRTLTGKVPYEVEQVLRELVLTVNQQGTLLTAAQTAQDAATAEVARLTAVVAQLRAQLSTPGGIVSVSAALAGNGLATTPIAVKVDGTTITINDNNELTLV